MRSFTLLLTLVAALVLAGCGGGGGSAEGEVTIPPGEGFTQPEIPTETGPVETGPSAATGGGGGGGGDDDVEVDEPISVEADDASITIVPLDDASAFMTLDLRRAGGPAAIKRGTCASPGENVQELGEATRGTSEFLLDMSLDELTSGDFVFTVGNDFCTELQAAE